MVINPHYNTGFALRPMVQPAMQEQFDIVVVGSGAAGLAAAITAAESGAKVALIEKSEHLGGTTAFSGALLWAPLHRKRHAADPRDSREAAISYILENSGPCDRGLVETYVDAAADTIDYFERVTPLRLLNTPYPDTFPERPGGLARGRHLEPAPFSLSSLGTWRARIRQPPQPQLLTNAELAAAGLLRDPRKAIPRILPRMIWRRLRGQRAGGQALIGALVSAALRLGVQLRLGTRARQLLVDAQAVIGVECENERDVVQFAAKRGVVLACGGFEWSPADVAEHVGMPLEHCPSPPLATGDNLRLAAGAGAKLSRLDEVWHWPTGIVPGSTYEGHAVGTLILSERIMPHSIVVNRHGRRFGNEAAHNFALSLFARDADGVARNAPAWAIFDRQFRSRCLVLLKQMPGGKDPAWLTGEATLDALARRFDIDGHGLRDTVARFNEMARAGRDTDFQRGDSAFDRYLGDATQGAAACLGTIEQPPFYAVRIYPSAVGTRGGPTITTDGQVVNEQSTPIPGLYAAGNAAACFHGVTMIGGGATVMSGMIFGRRAALHALSRADQSSQSVRPAIAR